MLRLVPDAVGLDGSFPSMWAGPGGIGLVLVVPGCVWDWSGVGLVWLMRWCRGLSGWVGLGCYRCYSYGLGARRGWLRLWTTESMSVGGVSGTTAPPPRRTTTRRTGQGATPPRHGGTTTPPPLRRPLPDSPSRPTASDRTRLVPPLPPRPAVWLASLVRHIVHCHSKTPLRTVGDSTGRTLDQWFLAHLYFSTGNGRLICS